MIRKITGALAVGATVVVGAYLGYRAATDEEFRIGIVKGYHRTIASSKRKMAAITEDVAVKRAKVTRNPKVNQNWVEKQWSDIGY